MRAADRHTRRRQSRVDNGIGTMKPRTRDVSGDVDRARLASRRIDGPQRPISLVKTSLTAADRRDFF
jgi:hypothetical protein